MTDQPDRARRMLTRPGAWLDARRPGAYAVRIGPDRRARILASLDEDAFRRLAAEPGLRVRPGGGWTLRLGPDPSPDLAGRPGLIEGQRAVMLDDGRRVERRANLGESPVAWLARRRDVSGRPWLTPAQVAAGERLRRDAEVALSGPSMTMRWDALPRSGPGTSARVEPSDHALSAARRVQTALTAVGPRLRPILDRVCVRGSSLQLAESELALRRRQGKTVLREGLQALAEHYGLG